MAQMCESGVSYNGTHLTGVSGLCEQFAALGYAMLSERQKFLLAMLSWYVHHSDCQRPQTHPCRRLDFLRGMSGAEKLAFSDHLRSVVRDDVSMDFEMATGCPAELFYEIGRALMCAKAHLASDITDYELQEILNSLTTTIGSMNLQEASYPSQDPEWIHLAEAFRQVFLLRILRFPDAFKVSCEDPQIRHAVETIFNSCAKIRRRSPFYKRLLFPLFIGSAETNVPHQQDYASLCVHSIVESTGFQHISMHQILAQVHQERLQSSLAWGLNVPWMEFVGFLSKTRQLLVTNQTPDVFGALTPAARLSLLLSIFESHELARNPTVLCVLGSIQKQATSQLKQPLMTLAISPDRALALDPA